MTADPNYDPTDPDKMRLPAGTTCGDCYHIARCKAMFRHVETDTRCDWSPSRFHRKARAVLPPEYRNELEAVIADLRRKAQHIDTEYGWDEGYATACIYSADRIAAVLADGVEE